MELALNHVGTPVAGEAAVLVRADAAAAEGTAPTAVAGIAAAVSTTALAPRMRRSIELPDAIVFPSIRQAAVIAE
jgi:hypothetical protein